MAVFAQDPVSILPAKQGTTGARSYIARLKSDPDLKPVADALESIQSQLDVHGQALRSELPVPDSFGIRDSAGNLIVWFGSGYAANQAFEGLFAQNVWIGPGDPTTAPFFCDGQHVVIGQNGIVEIRDTGKNVMSTLGVTLESPKTITSTTGASPDVLTIAGHGYQNGDTVLIAGCTGDTNPNGYRIVENVTTNTFTLTSLAGVQINGNGFYGGGGTATRYFAGVLAQTLGTGPDWAHTNFRASADGRIKIGNDTTNLSIAPDGTLTLNGVSLTLDAVVGTKEIKLDPAIPEFDITDSATGFSMKINPTAGIELQESGATSSYLNLQIGPNIPVPAGGVLTGSFSGLVLSDPFGGAVFVEGYPSARMVITSYGGATKYHTFLGPNNIVIANESAGTLAQIDVDLGLSVSGVTLSSSSVATGGLTVLKTRQTGPGNPSGFADATAQAWCQSLYNALKPTTGHGLVS